MWVPRSGQSRLSHRLLWSSAHPQLMHLGQVQGWSSGPGSVTGSTSPYEVLSMLSAGAPQAHDHWWLVWVMGPVRGISRRRH